MKQMHTIVSTTLLTALLSLTGCDTGPDDIEAWKKSGNTPKLILALNDSQQFIRIGAIDALEELKATDATPALVALFTDSDQVIAHKSIDAAIAIGAPSLEPSILPVLTFETAQAREAAAISLGNFKSKAAVKPLSEALDDKHKEVVIAAAEALGKIGNPQAISALAAKTGDSTFDIRMAAVGSIAQIGGPEATTALAAVMGDFSEKIRIAVVAALVQQGESAIPFALKALRSPNHLERESALLILNETENVPTFGSDLVWYRLASLTTGERPSIMPEKAIELGRIEQSADALLEAVIFEDPVVRQYAILALEQADEAIANNVASLAEQNTTGDANTWFRNRTEWPGAPDWKIDLWGGLTALNPEFKLNPRTLQILEDRESGMRNMLASKQFKAKREIIPHLIAVFRSSDSEDKIELEFDQKCRNLTLIKLKQAGRSAMLPLMVSLNDDDLSIAAYSAKTLVQIDDPRSKQAVVDAFEKRLDDGEQLAGTPFYDAMLQLDLPEVNELIIKVRPNAELVLRTVESKYTGIKFSNVPLQFDVDPNKLVAPFLLKYLKDGKAAELKIIYRPDEDGNWVPTPPLPDDLG